MDILKLVNWIISIIFFLCYAYQFVYIPVIWLHELYTRKKMKLLPPGAKMPDMCGKPKPDISAEPEPHSFAVLICARNEQTVIADLITSVRQQTYDASLITIFVMADNCSDNTAQIARTAGAQVYERFNQMRKGKGYALKALMEHIREDYPEGFDGYFIFDADNILAPDYIEQMNRTFSSGFEIVTSYRNSKNYGDNWISAGYALWFLRESRYLNHARHLLGTSCAVGGTGFLFSRRVAEETGDWPFHTLVEDIEFSVHEITRGQKIGFCPEAVLYDEQPTKFSQSWHQRSRWCKGALQVFGRYHRALFGGMLRGSFSCFDMTMTTMPAFILSAAGFFCNLALSVFGAVKGDNLWIALQSITELAMHMYLTIFVIGAITTVTEWRRIHTTAVKKILYMFTFPLFMFTYIPISVSVLFRKTEWKPIEHRISSEKLRVRKKQEALPFI